VAVNEATVCMTEDGWAYFDNAYPEEGCHDGFDTPQLARVAAERAGYQATGIDPPALWEELD